MQVVLKSISEDLVDLITKIEEKGERGLDYIVLSQSEFQELSDESGAYGYTKIVDKPQVYGNFMGVKLVNYHWHREQLLKKTVKA